MTRTRKILLAVAIATAATVPAGIAYAADGTSPGPGVMSGQHQDPADCQKDHAAHQAQMGQHGADMGAMRDGNGMNQSAMHDGTGSTPGT
jgi:hypothetical protein